MSEQKTQRSLPLARLIIPFAVISILMVANEVYGTITTMTYTLNQVGKQNAQLMSLHLASMLRAPVLAKKIDDGTRAQLAAWMSETDFLYLVVVKPDGSVLWSTDPFTKQPRLDKEALDRDLAESTSLNQRETSYPGVVEQILPIQNAGARIAILRAGFSNKTTDDAIDKMMLTTILGAILTLLIGIGVYSIVVMRTMWHWSADSDQA